MSADETLARRIQNGDRAAITPLVERHYSPLIGYLYRLTGGDRALAEDLTHETLMRALTRIAQYQYPRPFKAWLYAIATNAARNHYKSGDQRLTASSEDMPEIADDPAIDAALIEGEEAAAVISALHSLPDLQREVVILTYYQEFSLQEIADTLQIPLGTVKSRLSIGIRRLRERMNAYEPSTHPPR